ncbi:copper chaperone PCu(A)C [Aurantimonas marina]|uniref:copper chaperone PCu(A)C n=1 Tax=Aurantimonas marina TaxID=2780508 RepID=UPI0019D2AF0F|nr:copper chaperone PCu(A)C [Aurantimonas marina]
MENDRAHSIRRRLFAVFSVLSLLFAPIAAVGHSYKLGDITVGHVWASPSESGEGIAVYGPIMNQAAAAVQLTGASTPVADEVRIRMTNEEGEHWIDMVNLEPGKPLALAPWRQHLYLTGINRELEEGDTFELTLDFAQVGTVTVQVEIEPEGGH